jgi:hypothetical protein
VLSLLYLCSFLTLGTGHPCRHSDKCFRKICCDTARPTVWWTISWVVVKIPSPPIRIPTINTNITLGRQLPLQLASNPVLLPPREEGTTEDGYAECVLNGNMNDQIKSNGIENKSSNLWGFSSNQVYTIMYMFLLSFYSLRAITSYKTNTLVSHVAPFNLALFAMAVALFG